MSQNNVLTIVIDNSGSMIEYAKVWIVKNVVNSVLKIVKEEKFLSHMSIEAFSFSKGVYQPVDTNKHFGVKEAPFGEFSINEFVKLIDSRKGDEDSKAKVLLISDGNFQFTDLQKNKNFFNSGDFHLETIAIGVDASYDKLKEISSLKRVFMPQDVYRATCECCLAPSGEIRERPNFIKSLPF